MSPPRPATVDSQEKPRLRSVIVKPSQALTLRNHPAAPKKRTVVIDRVLIEGQHGEGQRFIHVRVDGRRDIDYFDAIVSPLDLVPELLHRLSHTELKELVVTNFRDEMKLDVRILERLATIFRTVTVTEVVTIKDTWFGKEGGRCSLLRLMNCFERFSPKTLDIWRSHGIKLDDRLLQRLRESGICSISLADSDHALTSNAVLDFAFDNAGNDARQKRSLDIGAGCNPIKRLSPAFLHFIIVANARSEHQGALRLVLPVSDLQFDVSAYERQLVDDGPIRKLMIAKNGLSIELPRAGYPSVRIVREALR